MDTSPIAECGCMLFGCLRGCLVRGVKLGRVGGAVSDPVFWEGALPFDDAVANVLHDES